MAQAWNLRMLRRVSAFVVAVAAMVVLGSAAHSYFVQQAWSSAAGLAYGTVPAAIPFADRISWIAHVFFGMILPYSALPSIALLIAFMIAGDQKERVGEGGSFGRARPRRPRGANGCW